VNPGAKNEHIAGIDINPLAIMISKAKTSTIAPKHLAPAMKKALKNVEHNADLNKEKKFKPQAFYFKNIYHWFKKDAVNDLSIIKESLEQKTPGVFAADSVEGSNRL
jgi:hypothetical protein